MKQSVKAAWVAFGIIVCLTGVKFFLYWISGSLAVLSEAWHSFADITTTFLVLVSILLQERKRGIVSTGCEESHSTEGQSESHSKFNSLRRLNRYIVSIHSELKIALVIGSILLLTSATILWRAITVTSIDVTSPLLTGVIFILLSFGSFFLYRFEESMGKVEKSPALTADSHHNRADMVISLLTGGSLVLYHFGTDIDRWVGIVISLFILSFALELLVNSLRSIIYKHEGVEFDTPFSSVVLSVCKPSNYRKLGRWFNTTFQPGKKCRAMLTLVRHILFLALRWSLRLGTLSLIVLYCSTAIYTVRPNEEALLFRLGRLVNQENGYLPGLHWKLPYPFDSVIRYPVKDIQTLTVGNTLNGDTAMIWTKEHGDNQPFISGDNNLFLPFMIIHYRISNIHDYHMEFRENRVDKVLVSTASRLLNMTFSRMTYYDLILDKRKQWTREFEERLQEEINYLSCGLEILSFCLIDLHPPVELASAYEDVVAAGQLKETYLNDARRTVNSLLSRVRIEADKTISEAEGYVTEKKKLAQGEAENYLLRYSGYEAGGKTMKDLLLLKAAEKTLQGKKLYLIDPNSGIDEKLLYIENFMTGKK